MCTDNAERLRRVCACVRLSARLSFLFPSVVCLPTVPRALCAFPWTVLIVANRTTSNSMVAAAPALVVGGRNRRVLTMASWIGRLSRAPVEATGCKRRIACPCRVSPSFPRSVLARSPARSLTGIRLPALPPGFPSLRARAIAAYVTSSEQTRSTPIPPSPPPSCPTRYRSIPLASVALLLLLLLLLLSCRSLSAVWILSGHYHPL